MAKLKTRYVTHKNDKGEVEYYTPQFRYLLCFWSSYKYTHIFTNKVFCHTFKTLQEVKDFLDKEHSRYNKRQNNDKVHKIATTEYSEY